MYSAVPNELAGGPGGHLTTTKATRFDAAGSNPVRPVSIMCDNFDTLCGFIASNPSLGWSLRIKINEKHLAFGVRQRRGDVDRDRCFTTLGFATVMRPRTVSILPKH
jgi:hypothetical protein